MVVPAHANQVAPERKRHFTSKRYNLEEQIELKLEFCLNFVERRQMQRFYLVGHSIGAFIALRFRYITCKIYKSKFF